MSHWYGFGKRSAEEGGKQAINCSKGFNGPPDLCSKEISASILSMPLKSLNLGPVLKNY